MQKYFHVFSVATPANNVIGESSPYITFDNDFIQLVPDSLVENTTNPTRYYFTNAVGEQIDSIYSVEAHSFLDSYLATEIRKNTILEYINSSIENHKTAEFQWKFKESSICCLVINSSL
jgi:hypothetical protein